MGLVGPNDPAWELGFGSPSAGFFFFVLWVGLGEVFPFELASFEDSGLGFFLLAVGSLFFCTTFFTGLLLVEPSVEDESTCSAEPSWCTRTGVAYELGVTACFLVSTVGVPLDCEISRVAGESSKGGGECPVWVGVDIAGRYSNGGSHSA